MLLTKDSLFDNRYRLLELKGRGAFGEVWRVRDEQMDIVVAVKVYVALDGHGVAEFKEEFRKTFELSHPNLLHATYFGLCGDRPYLVMPYCPESSASLVGRCDENTLWTFIRDVASGLAYLHKQDIIHRDIKPDNVLVDRHGSFLITDFGISTQLRSTIMRHSRPDSADGTNGAISTPGGSLPYMAPELFDLNAEPVKASDIWALGATLYELATDELPFFGQGGYMLKNGATLTRPKINYSKGMIDTILECMALEPWNRPKAADLADRAQSVLDGYPYYGTFFKEPDPDPDPESKQGPVSNPTPIDPRDPHDTRSPKKRKTGLWAAIIVAVLGLGGLGYYLLTRDAPNTDVDYFLYCKNNPTVENYRTYVVKFPQGEFVDLAKDWISDYVKDSTDKAEADKDFVKVEKKEADNKPTPADKKGKEETQKKGEPRRVDDKPTTPASGEDVEAPAPLVPAEKGLKDMDGGLKPAKGDDGLMRPKPGVRSAEPSKGGLSASGGNGDDGLMRAEPGVRPAEPSKGGLYASGGNAEEKLYNEVATKINNNTATLEDCKKYLRKYYKTGNGSNAGHWEVIARRFKLLYTKKIQACKTVAEIDTILNSHDALMMELMLEGTNFDIQTKKLAQAKKMILERERQ